MRWQSGAGFLTPLGAGPATGIEVYMTPKHDAKAVLRITNQIARHEAKIAELKRDLVGHGNRLSYSHGYCVPLHGPALKRLAMAS